MKQKEMESNKHPASQMIFLNETYKNCATETSFECKSDVDHESNEDCSIALEDNASHDGCIDRDITQKVGMVSNGNDIDFGPSCHFVETHAHIDVKLEIDVDDCDVAHDFNEIKSEGQEAGFGSSSHHFCDKISNYDVKKGKENSVFNNACNETKSVKQDYDKHYYSLQVTVEKQENDFVESCLKSWRHEAKQNNHESVSCHEISYERQDYRVSSDKHGNKFEIVHEPDCNFVSTDIDTGGEKRSEASSKSETCKSQYITNEIKNDRVFDNARSGTKSVKLEYGKSCDCLQRQNDFVESSMKSERQDHSNHEFVDSREIDYEGQQDCRTSSDKDGIKLGGQEPGCNFGGILDTDSGCGDGNRYVVSSTSEPTTRQNDQTHPQKERTLLRALLLAHGVDWRLKDQDGQAPLDHAAVITTDNFSHQICYGPLNNDVVQGLRGDNDKSEACMYDTPHEEEDQNNQMTERPHVCSICDKAFKCKRYLTQHTKTHRNEKPYKCSVCERAFRRNCHLISHIKIHTGEKPFQCSFCHWAFREKSYLKTHMRTHTGDKPYKCSICFSEYIGKHALIKHMRVHTGEEGAYKCSICDGRFRAKERLIEHMRIHTGERPFKCPVCNKTFRVKIGLKQHMRIHTREKPFECSMCGKPFRFKIGLRQHMSSHAGEMRYDCSVCCRVNYSVSLNKHMGVHTEENLQKCPLCEREFCQILDLKRHIKNVHSRARSYICSVCDKSFTSSYSVSNHMRIHTGEKPYQCSVCERAFTTSGCLTQHMNLHTGEKPFKCSECNSTFARKAYLLRHSRIHKREDHHKCSLCNKTFYSKSLLNVHIMTHSAEKTHKCVQCNNVFCEKNQLRKHMKLHIEENPHKCSVCGKAFVYRSRLEYHMRSHLVDKPFKCPDCDCSYTKNAYLTKHIMKIHTGKNPP